MARKPREEVADGIFHVFARGAAQQAIFLGDADRLRYLAGLGRVVGRREWNCLSYCLMDNHVHLLLKTPNANLGEGMHGLHGDNAQIFNRRHGRRGHLFQSRYGAVRVRDDVQMWTVAAYIARNPCQAGLAERPEDWRWSSFAATIGAPGPAWLDTAHLLEHFNALGGDPRHQYEDLVRRGMHGAAPR
jgi:REP element-mobilizing transposase RayT